MPTLTDYQELLSLTAMNEEEKKLVEDMPVPIAYGYIKAKRENEGLALHPKQHKFGDILGEFFN